jgi:hypothetical protein
MTFILGAKISGESDDDSEPTARCGTEDANPAHATATSAEM